MAGINKDAVRRVVEEILKVIPDRNGIDTNPAQHQLLEVTIDLHWGNKIKKILKVLTLVGARQTVPSQFIGNVLEMWKSQIIS